MYACYPWKSQGWSFSATTVGWTCNESALTVSGTQPPTQSSNNTIKERSPWNGYNACAITDSPTGACVLYVTHKIFSVEYPSIGVGVASTISN